MNLRFFRGNFLAVLCLLGAAYQVCPSYGQDFDALDFMPPKDAEKVLELLPDAVSLSGGIRFVETKEGEGSAIANGDWVTALYVGRMLDGTIFNQKQSRYHNFHFKVGASPRQIIEGWEIGMPLMQEGGEYTLAIPSQFAYKDKGRRGQVPPFTTVIFDIQILKVERSRK